MALLLYLMISGDILYLGAAAIAAGVMGSPRWPIAGASFVWIGLVLVVGSATPFPALVYVVHLLLVVGWHSARARAVSVRATSAGLLVAATFALSGAALLERSRVPRGRPVGGNVSVIGDSLSAGLGSRPDAWPGLLAKSLNRPVSNFAVPGATLATARRQVGLLPTGPGVVILEIGGNDILGGRSTAQFAEDMRALLLPVASRGSPVLMFELPLLPFQNGFGRAQRSACRDHGVELIPRHVLARAVAWPGHTTDGLHLSPQGHMWLANRMAGLWPGTRD